MPNTAELVKLPVAERLALIEELWASIHEEALPIDSFAVAEAETRLEELKKRPEVGLTYDELKRRLG